MGGRRSTAVEYWILAAILLAVVGVVVFFTRADEKVRRDSDAAVAELMATRARLRGSSIAGTPDKVMTKVLELRVKTGLSEEQAIKFLEGEEKSRAGAEERIELGEPENH